MSYVLRAYFSSAFTWNKRKKAYVWLLCDFEYQYRTVSAPPPFKTSAGAGYIFFPSFEL